MLTENRRKSRLSRENGAFYGSRSKNKRSHHGKEKRGGDIIEFIERKILESGIGKLMRKTIVAFDKFGDEIAIPEWEIHKQWTFFQLKLKGSTREQDIRKHLSDVELRVGVKEMRLMRTGNTLILAIADEDIIYSHLPEILAKPSCVNKFTSMDLPFVVGLDILNSPVIADLSQLPHMLMGGSSGSGKSVGLQSLVTSMAYTMPPSRVNFILIDAGAADLRCFNGLPHLCCPVIQTQEAASRALSELLNEMTRRIELGDVAPKTFAALPRIVLVIDEVPSLFLGLDKDEQKSVVCNLSSLLQRGRHGRIHTVLAAQDPTQRDMKVAIANITARIAYRCAKRNYSETILGETGAEKLRRKGELLFKSPQHGSAQQLQGTYIAPEELHQIIQEIKDRPYQPSEYNNKFIVPDNILQTADPRYYSANSLIPIPPKPPADDRTFAKMLTWALSQNDVSVNAFQGEFHMGWGRANKLVKRLEELGIVDELDAKLPRHVVPTEIRDLPSEMLDFLDRNGISEDEVRQAFAARDNARIT